MSSSLTPFDSVASLTAVLQNTRGFYIAMEARKRAANRGEVLREWVIHGSLILTHGGNWGPTTFSGLREPPLPAVCLTQDIPGNWSRLSGGKPPEGSTVCAECKMGFSVYELGRVVEAPLPQHPDVVVPPESRFYHAACFVSSARRKRGERLRLEFENAGYTGVHLRSTQNGYDGDAASPPPPWWTPWFEVDTDFGTFLIGNRKRVIHLGYADVADEDLFPEATTTHGPGFLHCEPGRDVQERLAEIRRMFIARNPGWGAA